MSGTAGYSSTPLAKKLGIREGCSIRLINAPSHYFELFTDWPATVAVLKADREQKDLIHFFVTRMEDLLQQLPQLKEEIK